MKLLILLFTLIITQPNDYIGKGKSDLITYLNGDNSFLEISNSEEHISCYYKNKESRCVWYIKSGNVLEFRWYPNKKEIEILENNYNKIYNCIKEYRSSQLINWWNDSINNRYIQEWKEGNEIYFDRQLLRH